MQPELTVVRLVDAKALCPEATCDEGSDARFVLDQQDPHQARADPTKRNVEFLLTRYCFPVKARSFRPPGDLAM
jgi:hypothetical protein